MVDFRLSYRDKDKDAFLRYFGLVSWGNLSTGEKTSHTFDNCKICSATHRSQYIKLRRNAIALYKQQWEENIQPEAPPPQLTDDQKKELIQRTIDRIGQDSIATTNRAVLANDVSFRKLQNVRRGIVLEKKESTRAPYKPDPNNYIFDVQSVCNTIVHCTVKGKKINWSRLARDNPVFIAGTNKVALNGNQILKEYALAEGLIPEPGKEHVRERRSKRKLELDGVEFTIANALPNAYQLKQETIDRIARGELDIGKPLVPITLDIVKIGNDGELKTEKLTTRGRAYSLQKVMDKLLLTQERAGYLRSAFPEDGDINVIRKELESKGEGFFSLQNTIKVVNNQCLPIVTRELHSIIHV